MPFGMMTRVGHKYHVLDGDDPTIPQGKGQFFVGNVTAHCKVMGHSSVNSAKTAEPIETPFWPKTRVDPRNHVLDGVRSP